MSETMKAAFFVEPGKMAVEEVPKAALQQDDDIVIRMVRTCVCGSDLWFFRGLSGQAAHSQVGHEAIGVVEETGAAVESVKSPNRALTYGTSLPGEPAKIFRCIPYSARTVNSLCRPAATVKTVPHKSPDVVWNRTAAVTSIQP